MKKYTIEVCPVTPEVSYASKIGNYSNDKELKSSLFYPLAFVISTEHEITYRKEAIIIQAVLNDNILDKIDKLIKHSVPPMIYEGQKGYTFPILSPTITREAGLNYFMVYLALE